MPSEVIGAGLIFLGAGCGAALSREQREFLQTVRPDQFYPLETLLAMLEQAGAKDAKLLSATGRRWGNAVKGEIEARGVGTIVEALRVTCQVYQEHHRGDVGELTVTELGPGEVLLSNGGPYPSLVIVGAFAALAQAMGAHHVTVEETEKATDFHITWNKGDEG